MGRVHTQGKTCPLAEVVTYEDVPQPTLSMRSRGVHGFFPSRGCGLVTNILTAAARQGSRRVTA
jgi:hypothetical protein